MKRVVSAGLFLLLILSSCGGNKNETSDNRNNETNLSGSIQIDGSSTVFPVTEAIAEEFRNEFPDVKVTIGVSGTGGGFKKFERGELDVADASRKIKAGEAERCKAAGIEFCELAVAYDGLAVVVNKENSWAKDITVEELKKLWKPAAQEKITHWNQIRAEWPNEEIHLYGAGTASGTFDYFTEAINGESGSCRGDYTASEDDNVLVQGIAGDKLAMGFFGLAYFEENKDKLALVAVNNGNGAVLPTQTTVKAGTYAPLSRPLFIYVSGKAAQRNEVKEFVKFYIETAPAIAVEAGYIALSADEYKTTAKAFEEFCRKK